MVTDIALIVAALALGVSSGLLAHEGTHAAVLHACGIGYTVTIVPDRGGHPLRWLARQPWAVVHPQPSTDTPPVALKGASLAPFALAVPPFAIALAGGGSALAHPITTAFAIGWLACAIPSPQDFAVAFHADRALEGGDRPARSDGVAVPAEPASD